MRMNGEIFRFAVPRIIFKVTGRFWEPDAGSQNTITRRCKIRNESENLRWKLQDIHSYSAKTKSRNLVEMNFG